VIYRFTPVPFCINTEIFYTLSLSLKKARCHSFFESPLVTLLS
jgi:hypothetical protein